MGFKERSLIAIKDDKDKIVNVTGTAGGEISTDDFNVKDLIKQVVIQLKINNKILNDVHDLKVNEKDIK